MTAPPHAALPHAAPHQPVVTIHLLSLGRLHLLPGEPLAVLTHRHMLSLYLILLFLLVGLDTNGAAGVLPVELRGAVYVISIFTCLLVLALCFQIALKISARRGALSMHLTPLLFVATFCSIVVGETGIRMLMPVENDTLTRVGLLFLFHYLVGELSAAIVAHRLMPVILAELRGLPIRSLAETDPALWVTGPAAADDVAAAGFLVAGDRSFAFHSVTNLRAEGNYVHLYTADRRELLPGPLSDMVSQMPESLGRQVHRSHWVATRAIADWHPEGREITLRLTDGQTVPVAVTRRREVRNWLVALGLPQRETP